MDCSVSGISRSILVVVVVIVGYWMGIVKGGANLTRANRFNESKVFGLTRDLCSGAYAKCISPLRHSPNSKCRQRKCRWNHCTTQRIFSEDYPAMRSY